MENKTVPAEPYVPADTEVLAHLHSEMDYMATLFPMAHSVHQAHGEMTVSRLRALQHGLLSEQLAHSGKFVPFYSELLAAYSVDADPFETLSRLPLLDKATVRSSMVDLCSDDLDPVTCRAAQTSGTSGIPLKILHDENHLIHLHAARLRYNLERGLSNHYKMLMPFQNWFHGWVEYTDASIGLARVAQFGTPGLEADRVGELVEKAILFAPDMIFGHPSQCVELARALETTSAPRMAPKVVVTFGERLLPAARALMTDVFQARVVDTYGMREFGTIAAECVEGRYHITGERLWVEVVDEDGMPVDDGQAGELVVTNLTNRAMPLLRYRTGDIGALAAEPCPCGSPYKTLKLLEGRDLPAIELPDGRSVPIGVLARTVRTHPVERFQVVQYADDRVEIRLAGAGKPVDLQAVADAVARVTGPSVAVSARLIAIDDFISSRLRKHVDAIRVRAHTPTPPGPVAHA
ncbi:MULTISPECIES: phenylacetate--CoA ligase family protein [unclassified Streptomyces]|uniref:phenylacetate--CoA ligase family protein n=1 Tax=unclassified Streptomyces TaxID=2593676 RepID=UPI0022588EBB|nr:MULTISPECIES: AMP-binding protein [unclassified Streptomyces]MCX4406092.1 AMP-binding protein [Streptomyces sp. NBC_01764]MCX5189383.1 AMP-binding protein [Streptomyces sp. NBC_00268]